MKLHTIFSTIKNLPKKIVTPVLVAAFALPLAAPLTTAQTQVAMEGHTQSLNVTAGETAYKDVTNAKVDEVVQVQEWHHNRELPDATRATNVKVKFSVPTAQGKTQVITGTTTADNANTITDTTTVNLSLDRARIEYIPGSAMFRYNKGAADGNAACETGMNFPPASCYATVPVSDEVVRGGVNLDTLRGGPLRGCNAHHETVTIQVRVKADVVSVNKFVRHVGQTAADWKTSTTAKPGEDLEYLIQFKNEGNTQLNDVMVGDNLPKYNTYVNGTTMLRNGANPNGISITNDNVTKGGINVGNYLPGSVGYVWFKAKLDPATAFAKCGQYDIRNVGVVRPATMNEFYNTAQVLINVECKEQPKEPKYSCDLLSAQVGANRNVKFTAKASASGGATIQRYIYNFGDGTPEFTTDQASVDHTYARDGSFTASVKVQVLVDGQTKIAESESCKVPVSFTPPNVPPTTPGVPVTPGKLPEAGPGDVVATFLAVVSASTVGYYFIARRLFQI